MLPWPELRRGLLDLFFPNVCLACDTRLTADMEDFCDRCRRELLTDPYPTCPRCSSSVGPYTETAEGCPNCRGESFAFATARRLGPYTGRLQEVILRMKHLNGEEIAAALGTLWARHAAPASASLGLTHILPIPLHWTRRLRRGYNQSRTLAEAWAKELRLPCPAGWLRRSRATARQAALTPTRRKENVRGAFSLSPRAALRGAVVLVIDDVLTTGATCHEAARTLKAGGAAAVHVVILAHGR